MSSSSPTYDKVIFTLKPSQWSNIGWLLFAIFGSFLIFPIFILIWKVLVIKCWNYQFAERTITEQQGVLSVEKVEINYYRIKSIKIEQPFLFRIVGLSNIKIISSDPFRPFFQLYAIQNGDKMRGYIKEMTLYWRKKMNVSEHDLHNL